LLIVSQYVYEELVCNFTNQRNARTGKDRKGKPERTRKILKRIWKGPERTVPERTGTERNGTEGPERKERNGTEGTERKEQERETTNGSQGFARSRERRVIAPRMARKAFRAEILGEKS
jgi:hypothetical protein